VNLNGYEKGTTGPQKINENEGSNRLRVYQDEEFLTSFSFASLVVK